MMISSGQKSLPAIGFLTIIRDCDHGLFGGFLVLNALGRPCEFHCTAPVRPNRAQEILYGPTLEPYLYGECIGPALLEKSKSQPVAVLTDVASAMSARPFVRMPLVLLLSCDADRPAAPKTATDEPGASPFPAGGPCPASIATAAAVAAGSVTPDSDCGGLHCFTRDRYRLAVADMYREDQTALEKHWSQLTTSIDLDEPFGRIRDAIDEARSSVRQTMNAA